MDKHKDAVESTFHSLPRASTADDVTQLRLFEEHWMNLDRTRLPPEVLSKMREYFDALHRAEEQGVELRDLVRPHVQF